MHEREESIPESVFARRELVEKISKVEGQITRSIEMAKIRRQKARRKKRAQLKYRSEVKG
jgi:hypothetical protein